MSKKSEIILHTAISLFAEKGFNEASIAEIAGRSGVAEGTIFYHFKSKKKLFTSILEAVKNGIIAEFDNYIKERTFANGMNMVEDVVSFFLYLATHKENWFGLLQRHYIYEFARSNSECREYLGAIFDTFIGFFEKAIIMGNNDGSIHTKSPFKTALILFSMVNGLIVLKFHELYDISSLYRELLQGCRNILKPA